MSSSKEGFEYLGTCKSIGGLQIRPSKHSLSLGAYY